VSSESSACLPIRKFFSRSLRYEAVKLTASHVNVRIGGPLSCGHKLVDWNSTLLFLELLQRAVRFRKFDVVPNRFPFEASRRLSSCRAAFRASTVVTNRLERLRFLGKGSCAFTSLSPSVPLRNSPKSSEISLSVAFLSRLGRVGEPGEGKA
jgi:hypothetical protein